MIFQDNVIKEYLKNVYFITGTPCGGKTTISRELAKRAVCKSSKNFKFCFSTINE